MGIAFLFYARTEEQISSSKAMGVILNGQSAEIDDRALQQTKFPLRNSEEY